SRTPSKGADDVIDPGPVPAPAGVDLCHVEAAGRLPQPLPGQVRRRRGPEPAALGLRHELPCLGKAAAGAGLYLHETDRPLPVPGDEVDLSVPAAELPLQQTAPTGLEPVRHGGLPPVAPLLPLIHGALPPTWPGNCGGGWGWGRMYPASGSGAWYRSPCASQSGTGGTAPPSPPCTGPG